VSQDDQFRAPAGWYPDPLGLPQLRWWNNFGWTDQVSAAPEPILTQEARYAWMEAEPPVAPLHAQYSASAPVSPQRHAGSSLNELEGPRAAVKVEEPSTWAGTVQPPAVPAQAAPAPLPIPQSIAAPKALAAPQPVAVGVQQLAQPLAEAPAPPPYWDSEDDGRPAPSIRPEDLKFWSGTSPAELRRAAREQAAGETKQ
jgi:hypothetical protein